MNREYSTYRQPPGSSATSLSRNSSNVSWGTKIKGAIQVTHGLGEAIRGSLGATDVGPHDYTSSGQIAERGRHEIAQGLARIRGVTTMLPPAPVYDRRHSYPVQQYEPQPSSVWSRRSSSAHHGRHGQNPTTASSPFEKYYEHPYPPEQEQDSGFAGLGAGIDPARRKEGNDRIAPAFLVHPPHPPPASQTSYPSYPSQTPSVSQTSYPSQTPYPSHSSSNARFSESLAAPQTLSVPRHDSPAFIGIPSVESSVDPYNNHLSAPSPIDTATGTPILQPTPTTSRRSFAKLTKSIRSKRKGKEKQTEGNNKAGRIHSMFLASGRHSMTRPSSPDDGDTSDPTNLEPNAPSSNWQSRSAPATPPPHRHESALENAGYDVLSYDAKDVYPHWPTEQEMRGSQASRARGSGHAARLEPVRSVRGLG